MVEENKSGVEPVDAGSGEQPSSFPIQISVVKQHDDGQIELSVSYSDDFKDWFMKDQGLKRWSEKRFQSVMKPMLQEYYDNLVKQQNSSSSPEPSVGETQATEVSPSSSPQDS